uniref:Uncharacterized protein n=1 Tax=Mycoplasma suis TaxID=57372 RepID=Q8KM83_9MOLU|nr:hypothetical protein [Mycoplasma suis]
MCPNFRGGVDGGRDGFRLGILRTRFQGCLASNLCPGCPCCLTAGWRCEEMRLPEDSRPPCTLQGLSEYPLMLGFRTSVLSYCSGNFRWTRRRVLRGRGSGEGHPDLESARSGTWTQRGWARTSM